MVENNQQAIGNEIKTEEVKIKINIQEEDWDKLAILKDFPQLKKRNGIILEIIFVTLFSILSFSLAMLFLYGDLAAGVDGGYYALQVKTLLEDSELYYEAPFFIFIIMAFFALISNNIMFGVYFTASLFLGIAVVSCYYAAKIIWNRKVAMLTLPFATLSTLLLKTSSDLIKNLAALVFIPLAVAYFNQFHIKKSWKNFCLSLLFSGLTIASHMMTALTLSVCLVGYVAMYQIITPIEDKKFDWKKHLFSFGILTATAGAMGLFWIISEYLIPVKETYWDYSSNDISDSVSSYEPSEEGTLIAIRAFFKRATILEYVILIAWLLFSLIILSFSKSMKERNATITLCSMLFSVLLLGISVDVEGWLQRMQVDVAPFYILCGAFVFSFLVIGIEWVVDWIEKNNQRIKLSKIRPKITLTLLFSILLIAPLIGHYINVGKTLNPIIGSTAESDLTNLKGKLPTEDCLIYAEHGLEYWASFFSEYQTRKLNFIQNSSYLYELLNNTTVKTYCLLPKGSPYVFNPAFNVVYGGTVFAVIEANANYSSLLISELDSKQPPHTTKPPLPPPDGPGHDESYTTKFNILTFILKLRIPVLTAYFHYYFTIPLTIIYLALLTSGSYRLTRFSYNKLKTKKGMNNELSQQSEKKE